MRIHPIVLVSAALIAVSTTPLRAQDAEAAKLAGQVCASCHGPAGVSTSPAFPKIAGQRAEYLENQLKAFRDHTRADPMAPEKTTSDSANAARRIRIQPPELVRAV